VTSANEATRTTSGSTKRKPVLAGARRAARALSASYRVRLLAWFVALLGLGTIATVAVVGEFLLQSTDERIRGDLVQESEEFRSLVGGTDPATGEPFGTNVERIFDVFLDRNVPARNEVVLTFVDGEFYRRSRSTPHLELQLDHSFVADVSRAAVPGTGRYQSDAGAVDFLTVPINVDGAPRGVFVVAVFRDIERAEQDIIVRAVTRSVQYWRGAWPTACSSPSGAQRRPHGRSTSPICSAVSTCVEATKWPSSRRHSTRCLTASRQRSRSNADSWTTLDTSCAPR
jgi:hypothetical protein